MICLIYWYCDKRAEFYSDTKLNDSLIQLLLSNGFIGFLGVCKYVMSCRTEFALLSVSFVQPQLQLMETESS
jgi:hypothetical protein